MIYISGAEAVDRNLLSEIDGHIGREVFVQHIFWQEEIRDFPKTGTESHLWAARVSGGPRTPALEVVYSTSWHQTDHGRSDANRPPLSRMYRTAADGVPQRIPLNDESGRVIRDRILTIEPVRHQGLVVGVCAVLHDKADVWAETVRYWLMRFCHRLAALIGILPAVDPLPGGERIPSLFSAKALEAMSLQRRAVRIGRPTARQCLLPSPGFIAEVPGIAGVSQEMRDCCRSLLAVAESDVNLLLQGDSGTGKELLASAVHACSNRHDQPFVGVNCAALPDSLFESELFGHKAGAFTGAGREKTGLLEAANKGTFFLDEIGDMPLALQIKLLRVMQEKSLRRIGDLETRPVNVRFVSASHKNLDQEIREGRFRLDLYYRLKVVKIDIPPLRRRPEDIVHLLALFLQNRGHEPQSLRIELEALEAMQRYGWPGNVRELENEVNRWCALYPNRSVISLDELSLEIRKAADRSVDPADLGTLRTMNEATEMMEKYMIRKAIGVCNGRKSDAARRLGLSRQGLYKKIKRYGMGDLLHAPV
jgi:DNA-binding NtrC family response regulator